MNKETLRKNLREIPDFPKPGILFYDVTTLFKNSECLSGLIDELYEMYKDKGITKVVGIESRGFILGGAQILLLLVNIVELGSDLLLYA